MERLGNKGRGVNGRTTLPLERRWKGSELREQAAVIEGK
ncbi:hypothetical protein B4114_0269 [Geobacillus stearothermophilus]|uniref:Uncharacterized protein n=1 Tax=Geobacillus stearothermophilus TaxID=1422 RepID=A0A150NE63_GEOSE|nr:hypothetical protein B4114_0269 [Geobacillus stearothermophilus]